MESILKSKERLRMNLGRLTINKTWASALVMILIAVLGLLGIMRACSSSSNVKRTHYMIARNMNWNDFQFSGKERNVQAFSEELVLAASKEANLRVQFVTANPNTLLDDLEAEMYDAVFTFMTPNSINEETFFFSDPLYLLGSVLVVGEDENVHSLEEMEGKIVGISAGSTAIYDVQHYPSIIIMTYENMNAALNDLANNKIDGVIMDSWSAQVNTHGFYTNKLKIATSPFTRQGLRLATRREADLEDFIKSFNDGLERIKASGQYLKLIHKWDLYAIQ